MLPRIQELITGTSASTRSDTMAISTCAERSKLYKSMIETMIQSMENVTRDITEFIRMCRLLWPVYLSMLSNASLDHSSTKIKDDSSAITISHPDISAAVSPSMESIRKHIRHLLSNCLPVAGQGYNPALVEKHGFTRIQVPMEDQSAYLTKFMLLAAFICQRNKSDHDEALFTDKTQGRKSKRNKDSQDDSIVYASSTQMQLDLKTFRVPCFPLERMLSVFSSIVSKYGRGLGDSTVSNESLTNITTNHIGTFSFFQIISHLRQVNLLAASDTINNDRLLINFTCLLSMEDAMKIAEDVKFSLMNYLSDDHKSS